MTAADGAGRATTVTRLVEHLRGRGWPVEPTLVAAGIWLMPPSPFVPVGWLLTTVVVAWSQRGDALLADETGLLLRHRSRVTRRYRWGEIREAELTRPGFGQVALAVYPNGGPWDVPGPNSAVLVGRIWRLRMPDPEIQDRVNALLRSRGVRTTD
ncbi:hypothetical protein GCE86_09370 [Micromonospora terminaliae]|uniref:PH domain-containing protein n=1 Tax=Micromonospora terminaliae TaxID=1914461 RepID=A0AAJ2ZEV7_9ACTN|nr:hypothetical protein [Micromonospora terminaliae]NES28014.1 hypothetical protein [Micromonospora terminaliae]QGL47228.1 hypothetical protein GCE86_09370 [Micromonospora terminaliae]